MTATLLKIIYFMYELIQREIKTYVKTSLLPLLLTCEFEVHYDDIIRTELLTDCHKNRIVDCHKNGIDDIQMEMFEWKEPPTANPFSYLTSNKWISDISIRSEI